MWTDPIVDEVHQARAALLKRFDGDFAALVAYLRNQQQRRPRPQHSPRGPSKSPGAQRAQIKERT